MEWLEEANSAPEIVQMFSWVLNTGPGAQMAVGNAALQAARVIGKINVVQGLLPRVCIEIQADFCGGKPRKGLAWAKEAVRRLVNAAHGLWGRRNAVSRAEGPFVLPKGAGRGLERKIREQFHLGYAGLDSQSHFLLEEDVEDILKSDAQVARGWLSSVLIARGLLEEADEEARRSYGGV